MSAAGPRYGMVVDLNRCVGCQTCTIACKHANDTLPEVQWRRVLDLEFGSFPDVERLFMVTGCQHCANPPCVPVCPTGATFQRPDGLVAMNYDRCIGCGACAVACPYQARTIVHRQRWYFGTPTRQEQAVAHPERLGVAQKCTFCVERIDAAAAAGGTPGVDPDVTPACAAACIADAITFGDLNDAESPVSRRARDGRALQLHAELGTDPQIRYLYDTPAVPGRTPAEEGQPEPPAGERQHFWDLRAATNFGLGGLASGAAVMGFAAHAAGALGAGPLLDLYLVSALVMACGLFAVFMEIGRKTRFVYAILRPQSSWMTRELYCVALYYASIAAGFWRPHPVFLAIAGLAAAGFLACQARIIYAGRGIPAWRAPQVPWMIALTGLLEGTGLLALFAASGSKPPAALAFAAGAGLVLAAANAVLWRVYLARAGQNRLAAPARKALARVTPWLHAIGHALPFAAFAGALLFPGARAALAVLGALGAIAGGLLWKTTLITRACHQQGLALPAMPQRGSGRRAAPRRFPAAATGATPARSSAA